MALRKVEQETIIGFNQEEGTAHIFTYSKPWQRHCEKVLGLECYRENGFGGRDYYCPKSWIRLPRKPKRMTPEQREALAERGKESLKALRESDAKRTG